MFSDPKYTFSLDILDMKENELLSEQETTEEEARVQSRAGELTVSGLDPTRLGYTTAQDCGYYLARIIAYTTYDLCRLSA